MVPYPPKVITLANGKQMVVREITREDVPRVLEAAAFMRDHGHYPVALTDTQSPLDELILMVGHERLYYWMYDDPALVHEIMDHLTTVYLAVFEAVVREVRVDVIHLWEDMCGRQGPLISPAHWEEFMGPNYRRLRDFAGAHGIRVLSVDTDGQPELLIPPMRGGGVNLLFPNEVAAGCDVVATRRRHPDLALLGGIDKRALAAGPEAVDRELARVRPAIRLGRYIPDLDHQVPDDVSWANFRHFAMRLKEEVAGA
jgi:uroporphyrinogen decarboxylase